MGRSGSVPGDQTSAEMVCAGLRALVERIGGPVVLLTHSMGSAYGWRVAELAADHVVAVVGVAPAPPGNIQPNAEILGNEDGVLHFHVPGRPQSQRMAPASRARVQPGFVRDKLIGASRFFPQECIAAYSALLLESPRTLVLQRANVDGTQVRVEDPARLAGMPVLVVTGTQDSEHPRAADEAIVDWLNGYGARAKFVWLGDLGIEGNGHMMMLETNSTQIACLMIEWLDKAIPA